jgi:hypothetical protein
MVVAEFFRQVGEEPDLDLVDQLEEAPRRERDDDADRGRESEKEQKSFWLRPCDGGLNLGAVHRESHHSMRVIRPGGRPKSTSPISARDAERKITCFG